jgi:hypothetical protein
MPKNNRDQGNNRRRRTGLMSTGGKAPRKAQARLPRQPALPDDDDLPVINAEDIIPLEVQPDFLVAPPLVLQEPAPPALEEPEPPEFPPETAMEWALVYPALWPQGWPTPYSCYRGGRSIIRKWPCFVNGVPWRGRAYPSSPKLGLSNYGALLLASDFDPSICPPTILFGSFDVHWWQLNRNTRKDRVKEVLKFLIGNLDTWGKTPQNLEK